MHEICDYSTACRRFSNQFLQAKNPRQLASVFCEAASKFLSGNSDLFSVTRQKNLYEFDTVLKFLSPGGPLIKAVNQLYRLIDVKFEFCFYKMQQGLVIGDLQILEQRSNYFVPVGQSFRYTGLNAFESYFLMFAWHLLKTKHLNMSDENLNSVYVVLLGEYCSNYWKPGGYVITAHWPVNVENRKWFRRIEDICAVSSAECGSNGLISPAFLFNWNLSFSHLGKTASHLEMSSQGYIFFSIFFDIWLCYSEQSQHSVAPIFLCCFDTSAQLLMIRHLLKYFYRFLFSVVEETDSCQFERSFMRHMFQFLLYQYKNCSTLANSFRYLLELWLSVIQPWRYVTSPSPTYTDLWKPFVCRHSTIYKYFFRTTLSCTSKLTGNSKKFVDVLYRLCKVFSQSKLMEVLKSDEFQKLLLEANGNTFNLDDVDRMVNLFYMDDMRLLVRRVVEDAFTVQQSIGQRLQAAIEENENKSWWRTVADYCSFETENTRQNLEQQLIKLIFCTRLLCSFFELDFDTLQNRCLQRQQSKRCQLVNQKSPMQRNFSLKFTTPRTTLSRIPDDQLPPQPGELAILCNLFQFLSNELNRRYGKLFQKIYNTPGIVGKIASLILHPSTDESFSYSPTFMRSEKLPVRISLRIFASVKFLIMLLISIIMFNIFVELFPGTVKSIMTINLNRHKTDLLNTYEQLLDNNNAKNWMLCSYEPRSLALQLTASGDGGLEELAEQFDSSKIQYAFAVLTGESASLSKVILIHWQGEATPVTEIGRCAGHVQEVKRFFKGIHFTHSARNEEDIDPDAVRAAVCKVTSVLGIPHSARTNENVKPEPVKSVYKPVVPSSIVNMEERGKFWAQAEKEEMDRVAAEQRRLKEHLQRVEEEKKQLQERLTKECEDKIASAKVEPPVCIIDHNKSGVSTNLIKHTEYHNSNGNFNHASKVKSPFSKFFTSNVSDTSNREKSEKINTDLSNGITATVDDVNKHEGKKAPLSTLSAVALWDYQAADETEISFLPGDKITEIDQVDAGWWFGRAPDEKYGLFPANFVELIQE
ncbi:Drebrin-like protein [Trichinella britovi]|uniref:Drebrin-like protein n=1 Tax=Trichinella britovi TaxID=45882 RepID=A0A0V1CAC5_TRIBR|nr:Drebrin-like protein [Trichinella britovi]KRZ87885.1 Drebrin-like protein [Trichinella sp. T8]